jgi:hypothetical protein
MTHGMLRRAGMHAVLCSADFSSARALPRGAAGSSAAAPAAHAATSATAGWPVGMMASNKRCGCKWLLPWRSLVCRKQATCGPRVGHVWPVYGPCTTGCCAKMRSSRSAWPAGMLSFHRMIRYQHMGHCPCVSPLISARPVTYTLAGSAPLVMTSKALACVLPLTNTRDNAEATSSGSSCTLWHCAAGRPALLLCKLGLAWPGQAASCPCCCKMLPLPFHL